MIKLVIIDDEKKARETIVNILEMYNQNVLIVGEADSVVKGCEIISQTQPDVVLLDINMPDGTGFDLLKRFTSITFKLIFITAYQEFAMQAIKLSALDYILKPINPEELVLAINKVETTLEKENTNIRLNAFFENFKGNHGKEDKKVALKTNENYIIVNINDIIRCESDGNYTRFFFTNRDPILVSKTLKDYEDILSEHRFFRPHKSHLINLELIESYEKKDGGFLVMTDQSIVPLSVRRKDFLLNIFKEL